MFKKYRTLKGVRNSEIYRERLMFDAELILVVVNGEVRVLKNRHDMSRKTLTDLLLKLPVEGY